MLGHFCLLLVSLAMLVFCTPPFTLAQTYTITDLGTLGGPQSLATDINNLGQVVGFSDTKDKYRERICDENGYNCYWGPWQNFTSGFVWNPQTPNGATGDMAALGSELPADDRDFAHLNDSGEVITYFNQTGARLLWKDGVAFGLNNFFPNAINDFGQIAGTSTYNGSPEGRLLTPSSPQGTNFVATRLIGTSSATGINDYGQVVGEMRDSNDLWQPFLWTPAARNASSGNTVLLKGLPSGGGACAISAAGWVVGVAAYADGTNRTAAHAFLWTPLVPNGTEGVMTHLGEGVAYDINVSGSVVGVNRNGTPILWRNGVATTLPLWNVGAINDAGQIVGTGVGSGGRLHGFLLTPSPAPRLTAAANVPNGQFQFTLVGEAGRSYTIQASTNLVNWIALTNFVSATGTNQFTDATAPNFGRRFYRAVTP